MTPCIALLRGINVGRAKRIAMADLRDLVTGLGHTNVRTLLNSGNVVFEAKRAGATKLASGIQAAIASSFGISSNVVVITAADLAAIVQDNPLRERIADPSRFLVAFAMSPAVLARITPLIEESWTPDRLAIGMRAAYISCAGGILESRLLAAVTRLAGETATTRNWSTVLKLQAAAGG